MNTLATSLKIIANLQRVGLNQQELSHVIEEIYQENAENFDNLSNLCQALFINKPQKINKIQDPSEVPVLICRANEWGVIKSLNAKNQWIVQFQESEQILDSLADVEIFTINMKKVLDLGRSTIFQMVKEQMFQHKKLLIDAFVAGIFINTIAIISAFYSMQIYDRVVPTGARQTLLVLTIGMVIIILLEFIAKLVRTGLYGKLITKIDKKLARVVYQRFLSLRLDQLPKSVGTLSGQMRGFETIRGFLSSITTYLMVDVPFVLFYVILIFLIGGFLGVIPIFFFLLALLSGLYFQKRIERLASNVNEAVNLKTGLLVESIEGAESIKSGQGGWRMLSKWTNINDISRDYDQEIKRVNDSTMFIAAIFQQLSFISILASGSLLISTSELTMGGLIACSILSGRVLAPVAQIPAHIVSWANTKASITSLDSIWHLKADYDGIENQVILDDIKGDFEIIENTQIHYGDKVALKLPQLKIAQGEKVGVLGSIGSGKTTLLRILSGMYQPNQGKILLDNIDLSHISKPTLAENIGFLQQEGRLFKGTLRENITLGLSGISDKEIIECAKKTGLMESVVIRSDKGLDFEIFEGGIGLSGGQKQLLNLTRIFLKNPKIWLLDEPTASLDTGLEDHLTDLLKSQLLPTDTLVLVTHKVKMLELVDRLIVVNNNKVIMDGKKDDVIKELREQV